MAMVLRKAASLTKQSGGVDTGLCAVPWLAVLADGVHSSLHPLTTLRHANAQVGLYKVLPRPMKPVPSASTAAACTAVMRIKNFIVAGGRHGRVPVVNVWRD